MASSKVSGSRLVFLSGLINGKVSDIDIIVVRKNVVRSFNIKESTKILSKNRVLAVVSHPTLFKSKTAQFVNAWCHPYRNPDEFIDKKVPKILLSESDFVDTIYIPSCPKKERCKWDYFYFLMGGEKNCRRKGLNDFVILLQSLNKFKLKGLFVNYGKTPVTFSDKSIEKIWDKEKYNLSIVQKKYTPDKVADIMASCRFGVFPNNQDCSPLLLSESLVRNVPVLVNRNILGGWKYINDNTGVFFDKSESSESVEKILNNRFSPKEWFMDYFGFHRSSVRLAEFINENFKCFGKYEKVCFGGLKRFLER